MLKLKHTYDKREATSWPIPNHWDVIALVLVFSVIVLFAWGAKAMVGQYHVGQTIAISLSPENLPYYALRTVIRMLIAMVCSLLFTFLFATWAAKSQHAERIIIPAIDILQSVPVLGFLSITIIGFIALFPNSMLGPECAAIFAIFTAQAWNMALSFYQSLKTLPQELREVSAVFQLSSWQRFWRIEVPFALPGLIWNMMMSMSGSWVFLVAAEAITVAKQSITLPGVGSYIALAIAKTDKTAILYVIITMLIVITLYDQLLFRPLVAWSEKFKAETSASEEIAESWLLNLFQRTRFFRFITRFLSGVGDLIVNFRITKKRFRKKRFPAAEKLQKSFTIIWYCVLIATLFAACTYLIHFISTEVKLSEVGHVIFLGSFTALRVMILIVLSSLVWVPIGVWIGLNPRASQFMQPIIQFLAAFPAILLFPLFFIMILRFHLNINIWCSPLMILGTQWYILFNVIAGTMALPKNLHYAVETLNVKGFLWWRKLILPGIFPYYITGAITAAGGAWNMCIIAEVITWGKTTLYATGIGAYFSHFSTLGDFPRIALSIAILSCYVLLINRLIWRPLYNLAENRFQLR